MFNNNDKKITNLNSVKPSYYNSNIKVYTKVQLNKLRKMYFNEFGTSNLPKTNNSVKKNKTASPVHRVANVQAMMRNGLNLSSIQANQNKNNKERELKRNLREAKQERNLIDKKIRKPKFYRRFDKKYMQQKMAERNTLNKYINNLQNKLKQLS